MHFRRCLFFACLALAPLAHAASTGVLGDWKTPDGAIVRIEACGAAVCLRVVQVSPGAPVSTDQKNPDAGLRGRKLCGLTIGSDFHQDDPEHLAGGHLYDPKSGHTYHGTAVGQGDTLRLRGYIGISLFGRTETWRRTGPPPACR